MFDIGGGGVEKGLKVSHFCDGVDFRLVKIFPKFSPERIEHQFRRGLAARVFDETVRVESNTLMLFLVGAVVLGLFVWGIGPSRIASGFLLDFKPLVHVIFKETGTPLFEMPDFVYA